MDFPIPLVCFTDPFSLSYSPQLSQACFQPQNISYPQLLSPERKHGKGVCWLWILTWRPTIHCVLNPKSQKCIFKGRLVHLDHRILNIYLEFCDLDVLSLRPQTNTTTRASARYSPLARLVSGLRPSRWGPSGWTKVGLLAMISHFKFHFFPHLLLFLQFWDPFQAYWPKQSGSNDI